jgi:hypothetical protein
MQILVFLFILFVYLIMLRYAYIAWFRTRDYFKSAKNDREIVEKIAPFVLKLWPTKQIVQNPKLDLWWARIGTLLMLIIGTVALLAAIFTGAGR